MDLISSYHTTIIKNLSLSYSTHDTFGIYSKLLIVLFGSIVIFDTTVAGIVS